MNDTKNSFLLHSDEIPFMRANWMQNLDIWIYISHHEKNSFPEIEISSKSLIIVIVLTVLTNKLLLAAAVSANKLLLIWTVLSNEFLLARNPKK